MCTKDGRGMGYKHVVFTHLAVGIAKYAVPILLAVSNFDKMAAVENYAAVHLAVREGGKTSLCDICEHFKATNESAHNHLNDKMFSALLLKVVNDTLGWGDSVQYRNISVNGAKRCRVYVNLGFIEN